MRETKQILLYTTPSMHLFIYVPIYYSTLYLDYLSLPYVDLDKATASHDEGGGDIRRKRQLLSEIESRVSAQWRVRVLAARN